MTGKMNTCLDSELKRDTRVIFIMVIMMKLPNGQRTIVVLVIDLPSTPVPQPHRAFAQAVPVSHLYRLFSSSLPLEMQMCDSARLYNCARCQRQVIICNHCDRGNIYCSGGCSEQSRHKKQQEAAQRYQSSHKGRQRHAQRQCQYRQRLQQSRQWRKEKVTHQGSPEKTLCDSITTGLKTEIPRSVSPFIPKKEGMICHFCGVQCDGYLRWDFLQRRSHSWSPHSVFE